METIYSKFMVINIYRERTAQFTVLQIVVALCCSVLVLGHNAGPGTV
jgi:hypothetical protein